MKKLSLFALILIATCTVAFAQPRAIGGRIGYNIGASYQHQIGEKNMLQADLDFYGLGWWGIQGTVTFNWIIPLVSVNAGDLNLYPGVGLGGGYEFLGKVVWAENHWLDDMPSVAFYRNGLWTSAITVGVRYKFGGK